MNADAAKVFPYFVRSFYWSDTSDCFIAFADELPGCVTDGQTMDEAMGALEDLIEDYLDVLIEEKRELPWPKYGPK